MQPTGSNTCFQHVHTFLKTGPSSSYAISDTTLLHGLVVLLHEGLDLPLNISQLDIGDPRQTFGLEVSRIAMTSVSILASLLALSHTSLDSSSEIDLNDIGLDPVEHVSAETKVVDSIVVFTLANVQKYLTSTPLSWQSPIQSIGLQALNSALAHEEFSATRLALSWVLLRLGMRLTLYE